MTCINLIIASNTSSNMTREEVQAALREYEGQIAGFQYAPPDLSPYVALNGRGFVEGGTFYDVHIDPYSIPPELLHPAAGIPKEFVTIERIATERLITPLPGALTSLRASRPLELLLVKLAQQAVKENRSQTSLNVAFNIVTTPDQVNEFWNMKKE
jgi:hypothetical protein